MDTLLQALLSNDNAARSAAEQQLKAQANNIAVVPELLQRLEHAPDAEVRQLAAVLLKKRMGKLWQQLPLEARQSTQALLLQRISLEPTHVVRRAIADLAAAVAKQALPRNEWPELLGTLNQWSQSVSLDHREVAFMLFGSLLEIIGDQLQQQQLLAPLIRLIATGLRDAERVRTAALKAVEPLMLLVNSEADIVQFHALVANLVECAREALVGGSEDVAVYICQLLVDMLEQPAPLTQPHLPAIVVFCMEVAVAKQLELTTREQALQVVAWAARYKPKQLAKNKPLVRQIVDALCHTACEPPEDEAEAREPGALSARAMAGQALDALALHVSSTLICPPVLAFCKQAMALPDAQHRCGAMTALAVICEGCADPLRKRLDEDVLPMVLTGLQDPDQNVRGGAAFAIGQMSEFMAYEVVDHYGAVLPAVFTTMADPDPVVQERACYALDTFCEGMERENILPFMPQLIERLVAILSHGAHTNNSGVQEMALSAIASTAATAAQDFAPYVGAVLPALQHFLTVTQHELLLCRCRATECMGLLLEHLGSTGDAKALIPQVMTLAMQGFSLNSSELREFTHGLFAAIAKALKEDFAGYLQHVVPLAIQSLEQDDGMASDEEEGDQAVGGDAKPGHNRLDSDEEGDSDAEGRGKQLSIRTGVLDEKCAALSALGHYAEHLPLQFAPFLVQALQLAAAAASYFHEEIRAQACTTFAQLVIATHRAFPPAPPLPLSPEVTQAMVEVGPALVAALEDCDKSVVSAALGALKDLLTGFGGPQALLPWLEKVSQGVTDVLQQKAVCFDYEDDDKDGEDTEDEGGDAVEDLIAAAGDLASALISATGADAYAPIFASQHLVGLATCLRPQQPDGIRGVAMGVLAEIAERMQAHMTPHLPKIMPYIFKEMRAEDPVNRQNAAFAAGVLVEGCGPEAMAPFLPQLLQSLQPLFGTKEAAGTRDNAVGCVARLLLASPGAPLVPLDAVLPSYLRSLPPKEDWSESHVIYRALCHLLALGAQGVAAAATHVPGIVQALGAAVVHPKLPQPTRTLIVSTISQLRQHYSGQADALLLTLPIEQQQALALS